MAGHALLKAVILEDGGAGVAAKFFGMFTVVEQISHAFGQGLVIEKIHQ